jgi:hypothetical protein
MASQMRPFCLFAAVPLLVGCSPLWQKTNSDVQTVLQRIQERDDNRHCTDTGALPGSSEYLVCRLKLTQDRQQAATQSQH